MKKLIVLWFLLLPLAIKAQNINGKIVDENGQPVPGANILIKGTPNGAVTNYDGEFKLQAPEGKSTLFLALVGHKSLDMTVTIDGSRTYQLDAVLIKDKKSNKKSECSGKLSDAPEKKSI